MGVMVALEKAEAGRFLWVETSLCYKVNSYLRKPTDKIKRNQNKFENVLENTKAVTKRTFAKKGEFR